MDSLDVGFVWFLLALTLIGIFGAIAGYPWILAGIAPFDLVLLIASILHLREERPEWLERLPKWLYAAVMWRVDQ